MCVSVCVFVVAYPHVHMRIRVRMDNSDTEIWKCVSVEYVDKLLLNLFCLAGEGDKLR